MQPIVLPDGQTFQLEFAVFDFNGTLAEDGRVEREVKKLLSSLVNELKVIVVTADTFGLVQAELGNVPGLTITIITPGDEALQKAVLVKKCGDEKTICIGNGANDILMFEQAALSIGVIGPEGACQKTMMKADVVVSNPKDAIKLLLHPKRLIATLRT